MISLRVHCTLFVFIVVYGIRIYCKCTIKYSMYITVLTVQCVVYTVQCVYCFTLFVLIVFRLLQLRLQPSQP